MFDIAKRSFNLNQDFINRYEGKNPDWKYNGLGYFVYKRTYARNLVEGDPSKGTEEWWQTCQRVVEGTFSIQKNHCKDNFLPWSEGKGQKSAQRMYELMWDFKFLPPGRGLWSMGSDHLVRAGGAAINNPLTLDTKILTKEHGWIELRDVKQFDHILSTSQQYGSYASKLFSDGVPIWVSLIKEVSEVEVHNCKKIIYQDNFGVTHEVKASYNHRWHKRLNENASWSRVTTKELNVGDQLPMVKPSQLEEEIFTIIDIKDIGRHEVACLEIPGYEQFVIEGYLLTSNCGFISTEEISQNPSEPFCFTMDMSMVGVGIGFDTEGAGKFHIKKPSSKQLTYRIPDSREGWVESLKLLINSFHYGEEAEGVAFDYSEIRGEGEPIKGFGGIASGPAPLKEMHLDIYQILSNRIGQTLSSVDIVDVMDLIGRCVVAGNVRRCLPYDSIVMTSKGEKDIEDIEVGDLVLTTHEKKFQRVSAVFEQGVQDTLRIDTGNGYLECTAKHRVAISDGDSSFYWVQAGDLKVGDQLIKLINNAPELDEVSILSIGKGPTLETYDIEVEEAHEFFADGFLVHNSALIAFSGPEDTDFREMKQWIENPVTDEEKETNRRIINHRWSSNNSIVAKVGMDYSSVAKDTAINGEPGYFWLDNARAYGRMKDEPDWKDADAKGANPCFVGETLIATADGRNMVPIKQLAEEGQDVPVYSVNEEGIVEIKWGRNARKTREDSDIVRVHLDDETYLDVTPDHKMRLIDGTEIKAEDLQKGDSIAKMRRKKYEVRSDSTNMYMRIGCDTTDCGKKNIFEHRLVAEFYQPDLWKATYDENKKNGWIKGGLVVHHKDYDPLNNHPDNLQIMTFRDHTKLHADHDNKGENNSMWGKTHSDETKAKIGAKTTERCKDPVYRAKLAASHTQAERDATSKRMAIQQTERYKKIHLEEEKKSGLNTVWIDEKLYAIKLCEGCSKEMTLPWGKRTVCFCSMKCANNDKKGLNNRKAGQKVAFEDKQRQTLHNQIMVLKDLEVSLRREPTKKEWEVECKARKVSYRIRKAGTTTNKHAITSIKDLRDRAKNYNHRVKSVEILSDKKDVYNLSVDDNHTVAIYTTNGSWKVNDQPIFTFQCNEQTLFNAELCCSSKDTRILTSLGHQKIGDLVDKPISVWNGEELSLVTPFVAAHDKKLYRVHISDGSYLDVTDNHNWSTRKGKEKIYIKRQTDELEVGMRLQKHIIGRGDIPGDVDLGDAAYGWGVFAEKGVIKNDRLYLMHDSRYLDYFNKLGCEAVKTPLIRYIDVTDLLGDLDTAKELLNNNRLPEKMFRLNRESTFGFAAGMLDMSAHLRIHPRTHRQAYRLFCHRDRLLDFQLIIRKIGINHASIYKVTYSQLNKWTCHIDTFECAEIAKYCKDIKVKKFGQASTMHRGYRDRETYQIIEKIEELDGLHTVYCFTEEKLGMGVFGNCLTYQCLVETFPAHHDNYDEYEETLKYAYMYAKTVTLLPTTWEKVNAVIGKNRRIGCSQSGIIQAFEKHGRRTMLNWCDNGYARIQELDKIYSDWLSIPRSIKTAAVKPSGSVSLLCGATPGIHYPHSEYYIRRVRISKFSPLVKSVLDAGYRVEPAVGQENSTLIVEFPIKESMFSRSKDDVSIWEQVSNAAAYQKYWADNQVSVTVTFNKDEADDIQHVLEMYEDSLKGISFLPLSEHGYIQAPYESIDKDKYEEMVAELGPIEFDEIEHDLESNKFCDGDSCQI